MLACASTRLSPPKPARDGVKAPGDLLHFLVRAAIQATPPGSMRMMSAGLMVELLVEQGLAQHQAKRLFSQIRKRAPLHDEWHEAFATGRFHQRQGRATLEAAAPLPSGLRKIATLPLGAEQQSLPSNLSGSKRYRNSSGGEKRRAADSSSSEDGSADVPPEERSTSDTAFALLELCGTSGGLPPAKPPKTSSHSRRRVEKDSGGGEPAPRAESAAALPPPSADRPLRSEVEQQLWQEQLQLQANVQEHLLQMQHQMQMLQSVGLNSGNSPAWPTAAAHQHPEEFGYHAGYLPQNNNFAPYTDSAANEM